MKLDQKYKNTALEMAINDFEKFCNYAGVDSKQLSVCIERERGLTLQQIALKLQLPKSTVKDVCDRCVVKPNK
jgi:hypothetical protein